MYADAEIRGTPQRSSSSATRNSSAGSAGEWIRFTPQFARVRSSSASACTARSASAYARPPAPKNPSISALAIADTIRVVAMPFAISPAT